MLRGMMRMRIFGSFAEIAGQLVAGLVCLSFFRAGLLMTRVCTVCLVSFGRALRYFKMK